VGYTDPSGHGVDINCFWCNSVWLDYSKTQGWQNTAVDGLATVGCLFLNCHVDRQADLIKGPTEEEMVSSAFAPTVLGVQIPGGTSLGPVFRSFVPRNFRENLIRLTGVDSAVVKNFQAHHVLPQKFRREFEALGLNVNHPTFGAWVDSSHQGWSRRYQRDWNAFFQGYQENGTTPTIQEVFSFAESLAKKHGFDWSAPSTPRPQPIPK
jgi:hypothetical protein